MNAKNTNRISNDDFVTLNDLWNICLGNRRWFAASICVCLGIAFYYLSITPKLFTREAAILVKEEQTGKSAVKTGSDQEFNDIGLVQQSTNVVNVQ